MLPSPARESGKSETLIWSGSHSVARPRAICYSRARVNMNGATRKRRYQ
jgi:hypothetical protein